MKRKHILYLGNQLGIYGFTPSSVETLGNRLKDLYDVTQGSSMRNQILRLLHMWYLILKNRNVDFILIDTYSTKGFIFAWTSSILANLFKIKYIPILHGGALPKRAQKSPNLLSYYLKNAYSVVCPSNYLKVEVGKVLGGEYKVIPNYIDINNYPFKERCLEDNNSIKLLWVRSFHEIYNPNLAVRIIRQLHDLGHLNSKLCMVGPDKDGSLEKTKLLARELGVIDFIEFVGLLSKKEWIELSKSYNIFINTSNVDNTPVSVIEAMALGFPIVSTNVGGIPYLFEDKKEGVMVGANQTVEFVRVIEKLVSDPLYMQDLSRNARKRAENMDWLRIKEEWNKLLSI